VVALVDDMSYGAALRELVRKRAESARRRGVVLAALAANGGILVVRDLWDAVRLSNDYAPEHLLLATRCAAELLPSVRNAGSVFVGEGSSVAFGDYMTGANHVLPTGGAARGYSGLSSLDFVRWTTYQRVEPSAARALAADVAAFASAEALDAHASAALGWEGVV
jgi:histidinol dehydrogenase